MSELPSDSGHRPQGFCMGDVWISPKGLRYQVVGLSTNTAQLRAVVGRSYITIPNDRWKGWRRVFPMAAAYREEKIYVKAPESRPAPDGANPELFEPPW